MNKLQCPHIKNMTNNNGNTVPNQFIISINSVGTFFQSYDSIIAVKSPVGIVLDATYWDYSRTTGKYRNIFLGETKKETQVKIDAGIYKLMDLNGGNI